MVLSMDFESSLNPVVNCLCLTSGYLWQSFRPCTGETREERLPFSPVAAALIGMTVSVGPCVLDGKLQAWVNRWVSLISAQSQEKFNLTLLRDDWHFNVVLAWIWNGSNYYLIFSVQKSISCIFSFLFRCPTLNEMFVFKMPVFHR